MTDQFQIVISSPGRLTSNLTHPVSYGIDGKNVVIYISVSPCIKIQHYLLVFVKLVIELGDVPVINQYEGVLFIPVSISI